MSSNSVSLPDRWANWRPAVWHALSIVVLLVCLNSYWFVVADRYQVFLYFHDMGPLYPDTSPFSRVTASRYWMTGLVANGFVLVLYTGANWLSGRVSIKYQPPAGWRVWAISAPLLGIGIPAITMTANQPTLPFSNALQVTLVALVGLALALVPGRMAVHRPKELVWLGLDGLVLGSMLASAAGFERLEQWLVGGISWQVWMLLAVMAGGIVGLLVLTGLRVWRRRPEHHPGTLLLAGFTVAYLLLPLLHFTIGTNGYFYITDSDNFLCASIPIQLGIWLGACLIALGIWRLRRYLTDWISVVY